MKQSPTVEALAGMLPNEAAKEVFLRQYEAERKSAWTSFILGLGLGIFGAHHYYLSGKFSVIVIWSLLTIMFTGSSGGLALFVIWPIAVIHSLVEVDAANSKVALATYNLVK